MIFIELELFHDIRKNLIIYKSSLSIYLHEVVMVFIEGELFQD
jgi:hypothetical protein